jgi:uncharacterized low-complexity protein
MTRHSTSFAALAAALILPLVLPLAAAAADDAKPAKRERQCSMPTSSRLQKKNDDCTEAKERARSYSSRELNSTGQGNAAEALRRLDLRVY